MMRRFENKKTLFIFSAPNLHHGGQALKGLKEWSAK
jgi:hypothetical protein